MLALVLASLVLSSQPITSDGFESAKEPQIAIDRDRSVYVAYGKRDAIYLSVSKDAGKNYEAPIKVAEAGKLSLGMRRGPRIAVREGVVTITATYAKRGGGLDGDLMAFKSKDAGKTWSPPVRVNDVQGAAREGLHAMATAPNGDLACVWLDLRSGRSQLYLATSKDGGARWSENRLVYSSPSGSICPCCHPSAAFDAHGALYLMFRNSLEGSRDMDVIRSPDGGQTFGAAVKLGQGTWTLNSCPMDGGSLVVGSAGEVEAIWRRDGAVYRSGLTGLERKIGNGRQGWLAEGADGVYALWSDGSRLVGEAPGPRELELSDSADDSVVAASPDGTLVVAAWAERGIRGVILRR